MQGVLALVARGLGAAVVPSIAASHDPGLHVIRLTEPRMLRRIGFARRAESVVPASAEAFVREVLTLFIKGGWPGGRPPGLRTVTGDGENLWTGQA